jgi:hypothetical protein
MILAHVFREQHAPKQPTSSVANAPLPIQIRLQYEHSVPSNEVRGDSSPRRPIKCHFQDTVHNENSIEDPLKIPPPVLAHSQAVAIPAQAPLHY